MAEDTIYPSNINISTDGLKIEPRDMIYDIASKLYTNTNFDLIEDPLDRHVRKCIYRAMVFRDIFEQLGGTTLDDFDSSDE